MNASPGPRTPPALRRRLDRLAGKAHAFHRFAHHPLCAEYASERIRLGHLHLCRGCVLLGAGLLLGAGFAIVLPARMDTSATASGGALILGLGSFTWRPGKVLGRLLPGAGLAFAAIQGLRLGPLGWAVSLAAAGTFAAAVFLYRRRGPHRGPCDTCPERDRRPACRGFAPILRRERALQRLAGRLIAGSSHPE